MGNADGKTLDLKKTYGGNCCFNAVYLMRQLFWVGILPIVSKPVRAAKLLDLLEDAALIGQLKTTVKAVKQMSSPDKLFLDNPNLMYALSDRPEIGTVRETFFYNQLSRVCNVNYPGKGEQDPAMVVRVPVLVFF